MQAEIPYTLTISQQKYLLALYRLQITGVSQVAIANELGVTKSSAHKIIHSLMELGLIKRRNRCEVYLSEEGNRLAEKLDNQYTLITEYLLSNLELTGDKIWQEAMDIALHMSPDFMQAFLQKIENEQVHHSTQISKEEKRRISTVLKDGTYRLPFQLLHHKENKVSMGDKGFQHPCTLELKNGMGYLTLTLYDLNYHSVGGRPLQGSLDKLWYYDNGIYRQAEIENSICRIPVDKISVQFDNFGKLRSGIIPVRVRATVGTMAMPESQARLKFNFHACQYYNAEEKQTDSF